MNLCVFIGNFVRDPETRTITDKQGNDMSVVNFTLAVNGWKNEEPTYIDCEAWGQQGDAIVKWFKKGSPIVIRDSEAKLDKWQDKATGENRSRIRFRVNRFEFAPFNKGKDTAEEGTATTKAEKSQPAVEDTPKPATRRAPKRATAPVAATVEEDDDGEIPF